jgi:hypothetical protein
MLPNHGIGAMMLTLANLIASSPVKLLGTENMNAAEIENLTRTVDMKMLAAFECRGQSCLIADTAGSTGRDPTMKAEGASDSDIACIVKHNPFVGDLLKKYDNKVPDVPKQDTGVVSTLIGGLNSGWRPLVTMTGSTTTGKFTGTCTPNILIFAKGTLEPGAYGIVVGPSFTSGLPKDWTTHGVAYDPDVPGDYCLGLPGGMVAKDVINQAHEKCPNSKLFVSGYSQGAMVIRNGLARASDSAKNAVKVRQKYYQTTTSNLISDRV